jgi:tetratricopeptide (TPR) repeat protein
VPFLTQLAEAQLAAGDAAAAVATHRRALARNPASEFLRLNLAHALRQAGRGDEARSEYQEVLEIDPRSAPAWLWLIELAPEERRPVLIRQAVAAGTDSLTLLLELAEIEALAERPNIAEGLLEQAGRLAPDSAAVWLARAELAQRRGSLDVALVRCERAAEAEPANPATALCVGRIHLAAGSEDKARAHLRRAAVLGKGSEAGAEAERLLASLQ